jgi:hypothetical protein
MPNYVILRGVGLLTRRPRKAAAHLVLYRAQNLLMN